MEQLQIDLLQLTNYIDNRGSKMSTLQSLSISLEQLLKKYFFFLCGY